MNMNVGMNETLSSATIYTQLIAHLEGVAFFAKKGESAALERNLLHYVHFKGVSFSGNFLR
jgi:hypothetical protein